MTDLRDELRDAERAVYARPGIGETEADRAAAVERLSVLRGQVSQLEGEAASSEAPEPLEPLEPRMPERGDPQPEEEDDESSLARERRIRRNGIVSLAVLLSIAAACGVGAYVSSNVGTGSLSVFNRPPTAEETTVGIGLSAPSPTVDDVRLLAREGAWDVYGMRKTSGELWRGYDEICVWILDGDSASGQCQSFEQFQATGIDVFMAGDYNEETRVSTDYYVRWGPTGPPEFSTVLFDGDTKP